MQQTRLKKGDTFKFKRVKMSILKSTYRETADESKDEILLIEPKT